MFQDIAPHIFNNHYEPLPPTEGDFAVCVKKGRIKANSANGVLSLPVLTSSVIPACGPYLFTIDSSRFFYVEDIPVSGSFSLFSYRELSVLSPSWLAFGAMTGLRLATWYQENRYCGKCGQKLKHSSAERMVYCENCGMTIYPRINPAVIVAVRNGEKLLLTKYARGYSHYALVAGFTESGETIEETVRREVYEETGIRVKNITYFSSQPWPHSGSLLFGFYCDLDGSDAITIQESELSVAEWIDRTELPAQASTMSLTSTLIEAFRKHII